jgi:hypothetical protein
MELFNTQVNDTSTSRHTKSFKITKVYFKSIQSDLECHLQESIRVLGKSVTNSYGSSELITRYSDINNLGQEDVHCLIGMSRSQLIVSLDLNSLSQNEGPFTELFDYV